MMWFLLLVSLAFGGKPQVPAYVGVQPQLNTYAPGTGYVALELSPATRIVEYPRNQPTIAQIAFYGNKVPLTQQVKFINKNKFLAIESKGYDEMYVLPSKGMTVSNDGLSDELVGASKAKLKSAFGKSMKGKVESRQLLNKFVKLVA